MISRREKTNRRACLSAMGGMVVAALAAGPGCAGLKTPASSSGRADGGPDAAPVDRGGSGGGTGGSGGAGGSGGRTPPPPPTCQSACKDFPIDPIIDVGTPPDAPTTFPATAAPGTAGPCVTEPENGSLFPSNWLRPRVKWKPQTPGAVHQITFHADKEANDLVVYTVNDTWALPRDIWRRLALNVVDQRITVTVRAADGGATAVYFTIAPLAASGSMVFWAANPADVNKPAEDPTAANNSELKGFAVGDEGVVTALRIPDVQMQTRDQSYATRPVRCIGCHVSTPDGKAVGFIDLYPWNMAIAAVEPGRTGQLPTYVTPGGAETLRQPWLGMLTFSGAHWRDGDRVAVAPYNMLDPARPTVMMPNNPQAKLAWLDVEAPAVVAGSYPVEGVHFGFLARNGDTRGAACPSWSHDGSTIVYSSTTGGHDGRLEVGPTDLYEVPYNNRAGGAATPLRGAAEVAWEEYYPAHSPDDRLIAFNRVPSGQRMYANRNAEVFVVPAAGGVAERLIANDPPACAGMSSPGINNHWPKWSPEAKAVGEKTYYWMIFSSNRYGLAPVAALGGEVQVSQLYVTAVVRTETSLSTYPAIYLWNQPTTTLNTTPAWEAFSIPVVP
jgi:hypothetical protein